MSRQPSTVRERITNILVILISLPLILLLMVFGFVLYALHRYILYLLVWLLWVPKGKDTLFVYSNSPIWHDYMIEQVLPLVRNRAVVLNWSERRTWRKWQLTQQVFYAFAGRREFNPIVIILQPLHRARLFRFRPAFKDWKKGDTESVERLRNDLRMSL